MKKNPAAYEELQKEYFKVVEEKGLTKLALSNILSGDHQGSQFCIES